MLPFSTLRNEYRRFSTEGAAVVIAPAERDGSALAREAVKFKFLERKAFDQQSLLFLMTEEVGMIIQALRKEVFPGTRSSPERGLPRKDPA
jgi:hypothetical protein